jgi:hypothetical protein
MKTLLTCICLIGGAASAQSSSLTVRLISPANGKRVFEETFGGKTEMRRHADIEERGIWDNVLELQSSSALPPDLELRLDVQTSLAVGPEEEEATVYFDWRHQVTKAKLEPLGQGRYRLIRPESKPFPAFRNEELLAHIQEKYRVLRRGVRTRAHPRKSELLRRLQGEESQELAAARACSQAADEPGENVECFVAEARATLTVVEKTAAGSKTVGIIEISNPSREEEGVED